MGKGRKLHNELSDLYSLPNILRVVKSRRIRWAGNVAPMGEWRSVHGVLVGRPEGKSPFQQPSFTPIQNNRQNYSSIYLDL
jgi:hypothetical protein